ncbi:39S ribosomal protein L10, mitochondrial [Lamellibrachia satsuma]|nr:39S ribosomal protein L10, mitochondrial [Lamellibrachia satsuma]
MATFRKCRMFVTPWMQCRHRGKINVKRPATHLERNILAAITKPIYLDKPDEAFINRCSVVQRESRGVAAEQENLYEKFLVRECKKVFAENSMVIVAQPLATSGRKQRLINIKFVKKNLTLMRFANSIMLQAIEDTKWANLKPLFCARSVFIVSDEPRVADLMAVLKKTPEFVILGGVVDNMILNRAGLARYAALPSLDLVRGELCSVLNGVVNKTRRLLTSHQQQLAVNLDQYVKDHTGKPQT